MLNLAQELTLESFQLLLVATILIDCRNLSHSSVMFRELNHFQKRKQQKKNFDNLVKWNLLSSIRKLIYELSQELANAL